MEIKHKEFIAGTVTILTGKTSANKVAKKAQVSSATISQINNHNWDLISDSMWLKVKVNLNIDWGWQIATTSNLKLVVDLLTTAQERSLSICISDKAGLGKTAGYEWYERATNNVIIVKCKNYWSKKSFARHQLLAAGLDAVGTTEEMIEKFQAYLSKLKKALVIYDQFDKLKEPQKDLFMDYYDELDGHCGFVLSGVKALQIIETKGCNKDKVGYRERYSRYGSKFIHLNKVSLADTKAICEANGVSDEDFINEIYNTSLGDCRRIRREVEKYFLTQAQNA